MISSGVPHADEVRWLPEACSEAPMQANLGAELGRGGDRLRAGSCIFLLDFEAFFFEVGRTIFGIAFNVGVFVTVAGALDDEALRVASSGVRILSLRPRASAKRSSKSCWYNASAS